MFRAACRARELPFALLYVFGPGGVGKTTLLREYIRLAREHRLNVAAIDARAVAAAPRELLDAARASLGGGARAVLVIDAFEELAPLHGWLADRFLPQLAESCLLVLAGRDPPPPCLASARGGLVRTVSLRNLLPEESRRLLRARGVARGRHDAALEFTHGHPLTLSLAADVLAEEEADPAFTPENQPDQPDAIRVLIDRFLDQLPGHRHRTALEATAHIRVLTEDVLARTLATDDARDLFEWLGGLSFMEQGADGLVAHELARELVDDGLRRRDPDGHRAVRRRARDHIVQRLVESEGLDKERAFLDLLDLHRDSAALRPLHRGTATGLRGEPAAPGDRDAILDLVRRHDGEAEARIAETWLERQPHAFTVFRGAEPALVGFVALLLLDEESAKRGEDDPAIAAAADFIARHGPLRPGEQFLHARFVASDQRDRAAELDLMARAAIMRCLATPRLAWAFVALADHDGSEPALSLLDFPRCPPADFEVGGRPTGVFAHDWRVEPPLAWLESLADREVGAETAADAKAPLLVLSRPEFGDAVRRALRDFAHPEALARNPLVRSRLVLARAGDRPPVAVLQELIAAAAARLKTRQRDEKFHRALRITYLRPAPTQQLTAARLNLPFGTYRYQLSIAIERVTAWLWHCELAG